MRQFIAILLVLNLTSCNSKDDNASDGDDWVLSSRKVYTYKLNVFGLPDTTYTKMYTYTNYVIKDSSEMFAVNSYDDERRLTSATLYFIRKDSLPLLKTQTRYGYTGKYLTTVNDEMDGVLTKDEKYTYDADGKLLKSSVIRMKNLEKTLEKMDEAPKNQRFVVEGYDSLQVTYKYDSSKKNMGAEFVDNRGNLIRRDINVYSGASPLASYNLSSKGDTLQRISYEQTGNVVRIQTENDDFTIVTAMNSGFLLGKITVDKKTDIKLKQDWGYANGRLTEEKSYKAQRKQAGE